MRITLSALFFLIYSALLASPADTVDFGKCRMIKTPLLKKTTALPSYTVRVVSPSGRFRFYYFTDGDSSFSPVSDVNLNGINDYVDTIAVECEEIYKKQVLETGISEEGLDSIPVYFTDLGGGYYGQTQIFSTGETVIEINSKIMGPKTKGMNMIRVTLAHEFHHVLHFRQRFWEAIDFLYYYEMSATFFEEVCYDKINDYRFYLQNGIFAKTDVPALHKSGGNLIYGYAIFFELIRDQYGIETAVKTAMDCLGFLDNYTPAVALSQAVYKNLGIPIQQFFNEFAMATMYTKTNSKPDLFFVEGEFFPSYRILQNYDDTLVVSEFDRMSYLIPVAKTGFNVRWIKTSAGVYPLVISNGDFNRFSIEKMDRQDDTVLLETGPGLENGTRLDHNLFVRLSTKSSEHGLAASVMFPGSSEIKPLMIPGATEPEKVTAFLYPNPFKWDQTDILWVSGLPDYTTFNYQVLSVTGELVLEGKTTSFYNLLSIPIKSVQNPGSGIFIVNIFKNDNLVSSQKLALIR